MPAGDVASALSEPPLGADVVRTVRQALAQPRPPLLVLDPLEACFDEHGLGSGEIEARFIGDGHSNITFLLVRGDARVVLRRPPRPPLPPSAHDVLREATVLRALQETEVPVPNVLFTCDDPSVLGVPFYVMEYIEGEVLTRATSPALATPADRLALGTALVDSLARLHAVDWRACGLETFGRPEGYLNRQVRRFSQLWEANRTRDVPAVEALAVWLDRHLPERSEHTIVHGDYRIGNVMFTHTPPVQMLAIFDWEMATLGDPLADLGYLTATYARPGEPGDAMTELSRVTCERGFPEREDLIRRYAERTGRDVSALAWYQVLALWKSCVFLEGSYSRYLSATTDDPWFASLGRGVPQLAKRALNLAGI